MALESTRVSSGAPFEAQVGYARAVRRGPFVAVSGTAAIAEDGTTFAPGDMYAQTRRCLEIVVRALSRLGAGPADVIRTRIFVTDISRWADVGRAHAEVFGAAPPATSMVEVSRLIAPDMLVEVEADAVVEG
jgi:enamine deaminase RidA (YjgF/YER057c/UK114 family)